MRRINPKEVLNFATVGSEYAGIAQYSVKIVSLDLGSGVSSTVDCFHKQAQSASRTTKLQDSSSDSEESIDSSQSLPKSTLIIHLMSKRLTMRIINMDLIPPSEVRLADNFIFLKLLNIILQTDDRTSATYIAQESLGYTLPVYDVRYFMILRANMSNFLLGYCIGCFVLHLRWL